VVIDKNGSLHSSKAERLGEGGGGRQLSSFRNRF